MSWYRTFDAGVVVVSKLWQLGYASNFLAAYNITWMIYYLIILFGILTGKVQLATKLLSDLPFWYGPME